MFWSSRSFVLVFNILINWSTDALQNLGNLKNPAHNCPSQDSSASEPDSIVHRQIGVVFENILLEKPDVSEACVAPNNIHIYIISHPEAGVL
ncbi:hypothetical protein Moror_12099 [Moniliophthora roreri MCA 2997]|uniref:Uncharacterized protein n=2 Tax=Moniliophthora roreri TaxID=221103 RepID=V2WPP8_MONRO|nr:hypothetical protein Moror_12099 [Moniliophthora roreri MCA 2997]KAI3618061.1 hypothetical protein WG66_005648 [Moniliophthora roreri]